MKKISFGIILCISSGLLLALAACGPSLEQQAAMTASAQTAIAAAWTLTPTLTITPTSTPTSPPTPTVTPSSTPTSTPIPTQTPDPNRYSASDGSFSFIQPAGWVAEDVGETYPVLLGPRAKDYAPNLAFYQEKSAFGAAGLSAMVQDDLKAKLKNLTQISEEFLTTEKGKDYLRWEIEYMEKGVTFRSMLYFFDTRDAVLVVTYRRLKSAGAENDALVDQAMETMQ